MTATVLPFEATRRVENQTASTSVRHNLTLAQRMALGTQLTELRESRGLTQLEVAQKALGFKVSHAAVSRLERGVLKDVLSERLEKLARYYGETVEGLLEAIEGREEARLPTEFKSADGLKVAPGVNKRIMQLRLAAGLTFAQMATKLGFLPESGHVVRDWESGKNVPHPDTLLNIAVAFSVSAAWLITGERAKPKQPTMPMRLQALQKVYGLTNRELAALAELDIESGRAAVARLTRKPLKSDGTHPTLAAIAQALDVPYSWLVPPPAGEKEQYMKAPTNPAHEGLSRTAQEFLRDMAELFRLNLLDDHEISALRSQILKSKMQRGRKAA